jgi:hypothetical protein
MDDSELTWAAVELATARMRHDLEAALRTTWRGRLALWLSARWARRQ